VTKPSSWAAAIAAAIAALALAGSAAAREEPTTFDGSCSMDGVLSFGDELGLLPEPSTWALDVAGTCTGTLDGAPVAGTPATIGIAGAGELGCLASLSPGGSPGTLSFTRDPRRRSDDATIDFIFGTFANATITSLPWRGTGAVSGELVGHSIFPAEQKLLEDCGAGTLGATPVHVTVRTAGPFSG
jgi:hypothetical protein